MEYATGIITDISDLTSVVSVLINGRHSLFPFSRTRFYSFGTKCDGSLSNILEEGQEVELYYKVSPVNDIPLILTLWCGGPPEISEDVCASPNLYDQKGNVSYFVDEENFLVQNDGGHYTVMVRTDVVYRDGRRLKDVGVSVSMDEVVTYDATPFDVEHLSGASYQATCAWLGPKSPRLVDRFCLQSMETYDEVSEHDVHGVVVAIPNDAVAVVDVMIEFDTVKVLLFRSSFRVPCETIRAVVSVGDVMWIRLGHCILSDRKHVFAIDAVKLYHEVPENAVRSEPYTDVTKNETELVYVLPKTDCHVPTDSTYCIIDLEDMRKATCFVEKRNAEVPDLALCNGVGEKYRSAETDDVDIMRCTPLNVDLRNGSLGGEEISFTPKSGVEVPVPSKAENEVNDATRVNSLTKHFNHLRSGTISGRSLRSDPTQMASYTTDNVMELKVRKFVGLGMKFVKSAEGVKEVIEVADVISTYSAVVQVGCNSKPSEACKSKPKSPGNSLTDVVNDRHAKHPNHVPDLGSRNREKNCEVVTGERAGVDRKPGIVNSNGVRVILSESHTNSEPFEPLIAADAVPKNTNSDKKRVDFDTKNLNFVTYPSLSDLLEKSKQSVAADTKPGWNKVDVNDGVTVILSESFFDHKPVSSLLCEPPILYMNEPPLKGVFSRYSLDCGMIAFKNFKVFVKPDVFYIDGVLCPLKHFIKFAKPGKSMVSFEAVAMSSLPENTDFTHEATCAWVGKKPSLIDVAQTLPPPKLSLLDLEDQYFCGTVTKLYLPDLAVVVIQGDPTTVLVHVRSFTKPLYSSSVGNWISDYVQVCDSLMFKLQDVDCESHLLVARDVRNRKL